MITSYKFIKFEYEESLERWSCLNKKSDMELGFIEYYKPWKQHVIEFMEGCVFNNSCLTDIADFLAPTKPERKDKEMKFDFIDILVTVFIVTLLVMIFGIMGAGCQQTILHPTEGHVYFVPEKIELETVNYGIIVTRHEGIWMSKWYFNELVDAKIE